VTLSWITRRVRRRCDASFRTTRGYTIVAALLPQAPMAKRAKSANAGEPKSRTGTGKKRLNLVLVSVTLRSPGASMQPLQQSAGICPESLVGPSRIRGLAGGPQSLSRRPRRLRLLSLTRLARPHAQNPNLTP
jgi:hypothetical protein